jgi:superfamily II DNA or RNA helicase
MFNLRYYQQQLVDGARAAWERHQSTAIVSATATGKTEMYLSLATEEPGRVLVLSHRDYLISQPVARLARVGFDDVAIEKADQRSETGFYKAKIVFASVASIGPESKSHRLATFDPFKFSLLIVDEGHRAPSVTYRNVLNHFRQNPKCKILILTATPNRKDGVALGNVCESVAGVYGPAQAMAEGWIPPVKFFKRDVKSLDFSNVRLKGTDLDPDQVERLLMQEEPLHEVCASLAEDRGPTIVFCPQVAIANAYAKLMNERYRPGRAKMLHAESPDEEREEAGKMLGQGDLDYIFNVDLYTEGYDLPSLLRVVWAAPTASLVRYTQGVGRVFRPHHSLREHLIGGVEQSADRRLLIEQSPKPFGMVVTYYPQNCKHELCCPIDILGGDELPPDVKAAAKQVQEETAKLGGGSSTEDDIETGKVFCDLVTAVNSKLKEVKAKASFTDSEFDPMGGRRNDAGNKSSKDVKQAAMEAGANWKAGDPPSDKQMGWFRWKKITVPEGMTKFRAVVVRDLIELGVRPETALCYGQRQALKVRDDMRRKANGSSDIRPDRAGEDTIPD